MSWNTRKRTRAMGSPSFEFTSFHTFTWLRTLVSFITLFPIQVFFNTFHYITAVLLNFKCKTNCSLNKFLLGTSCNTKYFSLMINLQALMYEGVSKSFRNGRLERELQMVQLSATSCSFIVILCVSLVNFATITRCVASQRVFIAVYFFIDSVRKRLDTPSYCSVN
jgi:hypothetical protein